MHFPRGPRERPLARRQRRAEALPSGQEEVEGPGLTPTAGSGAVPAPNEPFFVTLPPLRLLPGGGLSSHTSVGTWDRRRPAGPSPPFRSTHVLRIFEPSSIPATSARTARGGSCSTSSSSCSSSCSSFCSSSFASSCVPHESLSAMMSFIQLSL